MSSKAPSLTAGCPAAKYSYAAKIWQNWARTTQTQVLLPAIHTPHLGVRIVSAAATLTPLRMSL